MKTMDKKPNPSGNVPLPNIQKRGLVGFFRDVRREMKHVTWPTRKETIRLTGVVLAVCFFVVVFLWGIGTGFGWILDRLLEARG